MRYGPKFFGLVLVLGTVMGASHGQPVTADRDSTPRADNLFASQDAQSAAADPLQRFRLAAVQGDPAGLDGLGTLFERGSGVPVDLPKAYALYHLAASRQGANPALVAQAAGHRDSIGARMSTAQLARVNELIALCNGFDVNRCGEIIISAGGLSLASVQPPRQGRTVVRMEPVNGVYMVPGIVNGAANLKFMVDTGATDVAVPSHVVQELLSSGLIASSDFLEERIYRLADGSKMPSRTFRIRSLQVGNVLIENVMASIVPEAGTLLLGQSFLGKLKYWSIDNAMHVLIIE